MLPNQKKFVVFQKNGRKEVEKSWNSTEHEYFYKWRDDIRKRALSDDQILRRQKRLSMATKSQRKFGTMAPHFEPGNRVTDIIWEGLGYGYEFGPFIGAEVEVPAQSHQDAFIKTDSWVTLC